MSDDEDEAACAQAEIAAAGRAVSIVRVVDGAPADPAKPWDLPAASRTDHATHGLFTAYERRIVDGTLIRADDQKVLIPAQGLAIAPTTKDRLEDDGSEWRILSVKPLRPGDSVILYELHVRR